MKLSDFFEREYVTKDCHFDNLGLSNSTVELKLLSFFEDNRFLQELLENKSINSVICKKDDLPYLDMNRFEGIVISDNPRKEYFELHNCLANEVFSVPQEESIIGDKCMISELSVIDKYNVFIGNNVIIEDFVKITGPCYIGDDTIIKSGVKIGGAGFEFKRFEKNVLDVSHVGSVEIGSHTIIWENTTIHKAVYSWDKTAIGNWCRIGANSHIDHGAKIEDFSEICAMSTISGRALIGKHAFVGPSSTISNRVRIGDNSKALIGSVVTQDVPSEKSVSGNFAISHEKHIDFLKSIR